MSGTKIPFSNSAMSDDSDPASMLLLDRATEGELSRAEAAELERLGLADDQSFDALVGAVAAGFTAIDEPLPERLCGRLEAEAAWLARAPVAFQPLRQSPQAVDDALESIGPVTRSIMGPLGWLGWAAAAVAAVVAVMVWTGGESFRGAASRDALLAQGALRVSWQPWSDDTSSSETDKATGEVIWSDDLQSGVMVFRDLPRLDGSVYQLWIVDAERGFEQRISGGIFNGGPGEIAVPIEPRLAVNRAAAFAITIEKPGGTWVSDMDRKALIATVQ